jgi:hypothetical protein
MLNTIIMVAAKAEKPTKFTAEQLSRIATVDIDDIAAMSDKTSQKDEGQRVSTAGARSPKPSAIKKELKKVLEVPIPNAAPAPDIKNIAEPKILQEDIEELEAMPQGLSAVFENEKQKLKQVNDINKVSHVSSRSKVAKKQHIRANEPAGDLARMEKPEIFLKVEQMPRFQSADCDALATQDEKRRCAEKKMLEFITKTSNILLFLKMKILAALL